jgi:class 3 adenylate cyclase/tetratricopeptide (TPR) repeat protein
VHEGRAAAVAAHRPDTATAAGFLASFLPGDRRAAIAAGHETPDRMHGAGLFADISGFTPLTEALVAAFGPQRGAEELDTNLNRVYEAVVGDLLAYGGEVLYFSGDAITCWLDGDDGSRAVRCALDMQETMRAAGRLETPRGPVELSIKVAVVVGEARRVVVGDPGVQLLDVLGGTLVDRLAAAESLAGKGEVVADESVLEALGERIACREVRRHPSGRRAGVVTELVDAPSRGEAQPLPSLTLEQVRPWILPFVYDRLVSGGGDFLAELRRAHPIFVRFGGFDFDADPDVAASLDGFIRAVQHVLDRYDGTLLGITVGDKGAYLNAVVGTPRSHEDDARRAVAAAIEIRDLESTTAAIGVQVGVSVGRIFSGTYGHTQRRTLSVLGDPTNTAARLMSRAPAGEVYVLDDVAAAADDHFVWRHMEPLALKGKAEPVAARVAVLTRPRAARRALRYPLPLVGRDRELDLVRRHLGAARDGERRVLAVGAGAGMGKSRFVAEVLREAGASSLAVAYGQADLLGRTTSYLAWREPFRLLLGLDDERTDPDQIRDLERVLHAIDAALVGRLPLLGPVVGLDIPDNDLVAPLDAKLRKTSLEDLLAELLTWRLADGPLLLVLEDLQWIDPPSLDLLETLVRRTDGLPVLFLLSYRRETEPTTPPALAGLPSFTEIVITDLDRDGMRQVVLAKAEQVFGAGTELCDALVELVLDRSQGNPFYAEELVNYVRRLDVDPRDPASVGAVDLPDNLHAVVLSRVDGLDELPRQGLKVASVIGREFDAGMVGQVHEPLGGRDAVLGHLGAARTADLVVPADEDLATWLFRHAITRDVAYESIPFAVRGPLHERIGDLIVGGQEGPHTFGLIAHHYWHGGNVDKQRRYLRLAGDTARAAYANDAAIEHYRRLQSIVEGADRAGVLRDLAGVLELAGDWDAAEATAREARDVAAGVGDSVQVGWCDVSLGEIARKRGRFDAAVELLDQARAAFDAQGDEPGAARVLHLRGTIAAQQGDLAVARSNYEASRAIRTRTGDVLGVASLLSNLGIVAEYEGDFAASQAWHEEALALRRGTGDRWAIANSHTNLGMIAFLEKRFADARVLFEEAMRLNTEIGDIWAIALGHNNLGNATRGLGDRASAREHYVQALRVYRDYDDRWALAFLVEDVAQLAAADEPVVAMELLGAADRMRAELDAPRPESLEAELAAALAPDTTGLSPDEHERARADGQERPTPSAVELAISYCSVTGS